MIEEEGEEAAAALEEPAGEAAAADPASQCFQLALRRWSGFEEALPHCGGLKG